MLIKNVTEAKAQLSALLESVERGEEVVITRGNRPIAKLVPLLQKNENRVPGRLKGRIKMSPDFDSLTPEIEDLFSLK
jgi:prevent-host-death family protein